MSVLDAVTLADVAIPHLELPTFDIPEKHVVKSARGRHCDRYSVLPLVRAQGWLRKPRHRLVSDVDTQTMATFAHARCHCGSFVIASSNPRNRNAAQWRFCGTCANRRYCRKFDRCS